MMSELPIRDLGFVKGHEASAVNESTLPERHLDCFKITQLQSLGLSGPEFLPQGKSNHLLSILPGSE
jgi:hypothetical protein